MAGSALFERYWDSKWNSWLVNLRQGDYLVSDEPILMTTVLGSCVSACVFDPVAKVGGMNHFLLPDEGTSEPLTGSYRYGVHAMEILVNTLLKKGADQQRLEVKVCGAADVISAFTHKVGACNEVFIRRYLKTEHLNLTAEDLGGLSPRRIMFNPQDGRLRVKKLHNPLTPDTVTAEQRRAQSLKHTSERSADIELFDIGPGDTQ